MLPQLILVFLLLIGDYYMKPMQVIRNYNDANILLDKGHKIIRIDRDARNRKYLIFYFSNNKQLQSDLAEITPSKNN